MYHKGVLVQQAVDFLIINPEGIYVDATLGGGDHTEEILRRSRGVEVIALDRDIDAIEASRKRFSADANLEIVHGEFADISSILDRIGYWDVDGFLFDLGLSSHQIDTADRGFSFDREGPLDMRADRSTGASASDILNRYSQEELFRVFSQYGQLKGSNRLAGAIIAARPLKTTADLRRVALAVFGSAKVASTLSRVFQAVRMEVNGEIVQLEQALAQAHDRLVPGGRLVVISYHSIEDRIVKKFFDYAAKKCVCPDEMPICRCGKEQTLKILTRKGIKPDEAEISDNPRARSAIMRVAERI